MMMMMLQMFPPSVQLASLPDNLLTRKSCKQFDFKGFMTSRKKLIKRKKGRNKIRAKSKPEGQRLSLKSQWRACPTHLQSTASRSCLPAKSPRLHWVLPAGPMSQGIVQPWMESPQTEVCRTWGFHPTHSENSCIFSENSYEISKNCLSFQHEQVKSKY